MVRAEYPYWYGKAEKSTDVGQIVEHFRRQHKVVRESGEYARRELEARDRMVRQLSETGLDSGEAEEIMIWYSEVFQDIYFELDLKVGARLGAEYLMEKGIRTAGKEGRHEEGGLP